MARAGVVASIWGAAFGWGADARADGCDAYVGPTIVTTVSGSTVTEASGIAASRTRDGVFFTHGDSGAAPVIAAFDTSGALLGEHTVVDATNEDWEDIASAPCPDEGDCLYIGDIGDNAATRQQITVYVIREPKEGDDKVHTLARYLATYPDGPRDAETLLMMPCTGRLHVVTKVSTGESEVFRFPAVPEDKQTVVLEKVSNVFVDGPTAESREITGGAWDDSGDRVALRTSDRVFAWATDPARPNDHWLDAPLELVGAGEAQGEGLTYGVDGDLYGTGEGTPIPLTRYDCTAPTDGADAACTFPQTGKRCGCAEAPQPGALAGWLAGAAALVTLRRRRSRAAGGDRAR